MNRYIRSITAFALLVLALTGCRKEVYQAYSEEEKVAISAQKDTVCGMYILNNGGKGNNETTLDYFDFATSTYHRNVYSARNPNAVPTLGDNGVDLKYHAGQLFVVLNNSHNIEVLDAYTTQHIGTIPVNDCRSVVFRPSRNEGYATSYLRPGLSENQPPIGEVIRFDLTSLRTTGRVTVGYQPEEMLIMADSIMVVSNSGAYNTPNYDNRLSVLNLNDFMQTGYMTVEKGKNLNALAQAHNYLWVASRGDYGDYKSKISTFYFKEESSFFERTDEYNIPCIYMHNASDTLYVISGEQSPSGYSRNVDYLRFSMRSGKQLSGSFITDGTQEEIQSPICVAVHPITKDIFVTDAKNFTSSGMLYCYSPQGKRRWSVRTGIIPQKIAFVWKK